MVNTVNVASEKAALLNVKNKKNKQKRNSDASTSTINTEVMSVSAPIKHNVPTLENIVKNQSPNKKKRDKKKSNDNVYKQVNKNEGKITETVQLAASKKLRNKMKKGKQLGQLNSDKYKHQVNKQGIRNKGKKKFQPK